jgi:hypothetical protein
MCRSLLLILFVAGHLVVCLSAASSAQERKGGEDDEKLAKEINALVKKLGSSSFADREEAQKKLLKIGNAAKKQLESVKKTGDAEVSQRASSILDAIRKDETDRSVRQVLNVEEEFRVAKLKNDTAAMNRILAENFYDTNQNGNSRNKRETIELWTNFQVESLVIEKTEVRLTTHTAVVTGQQTAKNPSGVDHMLFMRVYERGQEGWQLVAAMQYRDPTRKDGLPGR